MDRCIDDWYMDGQIAYSRYIDGKVDSVAGKGREMDGCMARMEFHANVLICRYEQMEVGQIGENKEPMERHHGWGGR